MKRIALAAAMAAVSLGAGPATRPAGVTPKTYECRPAAGKIVVDGKLDEPAWQQAAWTEEFVTLRSAAKPSVQTRAKLTWDETNLYIAAEMQTAHIRATEKQHDANLYVTDGVFEVFLDPDGDSHDYAEIEFSALGTVMDLLMDKPYSAGGNFDMAWEAKEMKVGVAVDGTVNNSSDTDKGWTLEVAIPWTSLAGMAHRSCPPAAGDEWRVQLARCEHVVKSLPGGKYEASTAKDAGYSGWSPQGVANLHMPERWGVVKFAGGATSSPQP